MTKHQKEQIIKMRRDGFSYSSISTTLDISENTVKSFCRRNNLGSIHIETSLQKDGAFCRQCGTPLAQTSGVKRKQFCSDKCRMAWWNNHPESVNRKAIYTFTCPICGREFESYGNKNRKYCSRACYGRSKAVRHG
ncbi:MAG: RNA polymerase subunit sigma-70 [Syntrophomonadaceae bacterium]|nr:RNA polymerase subunit sigma-70 [Syntrophomonadaceae bacterium]